MNVPGFELWIPPKPDEVKEGVLTYEIVGTDAQFVQFPMSPGSKVNCVSGGMAYMSNNIKMAVKFGGFAKTFGRLAGGGSLMMVEYTNEDSNDGYIAMTPDYPGIIVPINMKETTNLCALRDSYLCSLVDASGQETEVGAGFNPANSILAACCSNFDFIVQTISKGEWAFLMAMGTVITKQLASDETILVDGDALLCFDTSVELDIQKVGGICAMCCAGEGFFHVKLTGPGKVWLQSMGIDKMRKLFPPQQHHVGSSGGDGNGDGDNDDGDWGDGGGGDGE